MASSRIPGVIGNFLDDPIADINDGTLDLLRIYAHIAY